VSFAVTGAAGRQTRIFYLVAGVGWVKRSADPTLAEIATCVGSSLTLDPTYLILFVGRLRTARQPLLEDLQDELRSGRSVRVTPHKFAGRAGSSYGFVALSERGIRGNEGIQSCLQLTATCVRTRHRIHDSLACLYPRLQCAHTRLFLRQALRAKYREHDATCHQDSHRFLPRQ
jgi:hypothetical protein